MIHEVSYVGKPVFEFQQFAEGLALEGHDVYVLQFPEGMTRKEISKFAGHSRISGRAYSSSSVTLVTQNLPGGGIFSRLFAAALAPQYLAKLFRDLRPDAILCYAVPTYGWQAALEAKRNKIPFLFRAIDVSHLIRKGVFSPLVFLASLKVHRLAGGISTHNQALADSLSRDKKVTCPISIDLPPVDLRDFQFDAEKRSSQRKIYQINLDEKVILFLGSLFSFSGVLKAASCFRESSKKGEVFLIAGDGKLFRKITRFIAEFSEPNKGRIIALGRVKYSELGELFAAADVAINTLEPKKVAHLALPNKVLQYLASGLPVVSTSLEGLRSVDRVSREVMFAENPEQVMTHAIWVLRSESRTESPRTNRLGDTYSAKHTIEILESRLNALLRA